MKNIKVRHTRHSDIPFLVDVEFDRYAVMYKDSPRPRRDLEALFSKRLDIAGDWMWSVCLDGKPVGFLSAMPTNSSPDDFVSWEDCTNNGTLVGKYDPAGRNVYVVNLDVLRTATKINGQYMLMAQLGAKLIKTGKQFVYFESRMPMFSDWVGNSKNVGIERWDTMSKAEKLELATMYSELKIMRGNKSYYYDRLLEFYGGSGFVFDKVIPGAFKDKESLDFGVVCRADNPLPKLLRWWPIEPIVAFMVSMLGSTPAILQKFIG